MNTLMKAVAAKAGIQALAAVASGEPADTATAPDAHRIAHARDVGARGVFRPRVPTPDGGARDLTFTFRDGAFVDAQTGSTWTVTGHATAGPLAGTRLEPVLHHDTFAFAWFAFRPETTLYSE